MRAASCSDPISELLPWYVNGSLEDASVEEHLVSCAACGAEVDALLSMVRMAESEALPVLSDRESPRRSLRLAGLAAAAALLLVAGAGLQRLITGEPDVRPAVVLLLTAATDADDVPLLRIPEGTEQVVLTFAPVVTGRVRREVEVSSPEGEHLVLEEHSLRPGPRGRLSYAAPADFFDAPGRYAVTVRVLEAGEERVYTLPFRTLPRSPETSG